MGEVMMAVPEGEAVRQAELIVLGQMRDQMSEMTKSLISTQTKLGSVAEDVAGIKGQLTTTARLEERVDELEDEVDDLRMRNAKQDGAAALFQFMKDYGGWLAGLAGLAYGLFGHH